MRQIFWNLQAILLLLVTTACGGKVVEEPKVAEAPALVSVVPADGATDVEYQNSLNVVFTYDQNIKCLNNSVTVNEGATVDKVNAYNTQLTVTLGNLKGKTTYTVTVPSGAVVGFKENQTAASGASLRFTTKETVLPPPSEDEIPEPEDNAAWKQLEKLGLGWNMGNHFDAFYNGSWAGDKFLWPDETCWGNPKCTRQTFTKVYAAGFRSVRIPITWLKTIGEGPDYKIDETWMNRIIEVVGWARDARLQVIINTHHDEDHYYGNESMGHRWLNHIIYYCLFMGVI